MFTFLSWQLLCIIALWGLTVLSWPSVSEALVRRDWQPNQVNQTMCWWEQPRSAVIRDTLYIDGGYLGYLPGFANGSVGAPIQPEDGQLMYAINFTQAFSTSQNASEILRAVEKTAGAANNLAPNFYDGMMFANDNEFYLYGGLLRDTSSLQPPPGLTILGYERFQYGPLRESWKPGFYNGQLPDGLTRYITAGAGVNVPSENLGFYFSGMEEPSGREIRNRGRPQYNATTIATSLISVDMSTMRAENWTNSTIPSSITGRANAELVWVPNGEQGLLIAVGGVIQPEWAFRPKSDAQQEQSAKKNTSPGFMKSVSIYDIKGRSWFMQDTSGDTPPQLTQFCAVVATAKDGSSSNIYIYGGYDGLSSGDAPIDDVYILSLPSFTWVKAYTGKTAHGRRSHKCAKVYPDQMFVVGGQTQQLDNYNCLGGGLIQIFNLNTLQWQDKYDPTVWSEYKVPSLVTSKIGGNADGGATTLQPSKWANDSVSSLFGVKYTKTIPTYYPYPSVVPSSTSGGVPTRLSTNIPTSVPFKSPSLPKWVAPFLGVVLGLMALVALLILLLVLRRRQVIKKQRDGTTSDADTSRGNRILDWIPYPTHKMTDTNGTDSTTDSGTVVGSASTEKVAILGVIPHTVMHEAASDPVHEMQDTSPPVELPTSETSDDKYLYSVGLSPSPRPLRPRPPLATTSTSSSGGAGIPRPESPTTSTHSSFQRVPSPPALTSDASSPTSTASPTGEKTATAPRAAGGHSRQVSSIDTTTPASPRGHHRQVSSLDSTAENVSLEEGSSLRQGAGGRGLEGVVSPEVGQSASFGRQPQRESAPQLGVVREGEGQDAQAERRRGSSFGEEFR